MIKRKYFIKEYDEEYYIFDSTKISEERVDLYSEYGYNVFTSAMVGDDVVDLLNEQDELIKELKQEVETLQDQLAHGVSDLCGDVE